MAYNLYNASNIVAKSILRGHDGYGLPPTPEQLARLEALGWTPEYRSRTKWDRFISELAAFKEANGHVDVPAGYVTASGYHLYEVDARAKAALRGTISVIQCVPPGPDQVAQLQEMGWSWETRWDAFLREVKTYKDEHGHCQVPKSYTAASGFALGAAVRNKRQQRRTRSLDEERIAQLDALGFAWKIERARTEPKPRRQFFEAHRGDVLGVLTVVSEPFIKEGKQHSHHNVSVRCACGAVFDVMVTSLRKQQGCPSCAQRLFGQNKKRDSQYKGVLAYHKKIKQKIYSGWVGSIRIDGKLRSKQFPFTEDGEVSAAKWWDAQTMALYENNQLVIPYLNYAQDWAEAGAA